MSTLFDAIVARRSQYQIGPACALSDAELKELLLLCVRNTPSMFNMQSTRIVLLLDEDHRLFWDLCMESVGEETLKKRPNVAWEYYSKVEEKLANLRTGKGTVLFFEDTEVLDTTAEKYQAYARNFETWANQSSAMCQYAVWLAFTTCSPVIGATLQHYYPDMERVRAQWKVPASYRMTGQMPFGGLTGTPVDKPIRADDELLQVFG